MVGNSRQICCDEIVHDACRGPGTQSQERYHCPSQEFYRRDIRTPLTESKSAIRAGSGSTTPWGTKMAQCTDQGFGARLPPREEFTCGLGQLDAYVFLRQPSNNAMLTPKFLISQQGWKLLLQEPQIPLVWGGLCREKTSSWTDLSLHTRWARAGQDPLNPLGTGWTDVRDSSHQRGSLRWTPQIYV